MKYESSKDLYAITRRIYRELRDNSDNIVLRKLRGVYGTYERDIELVTLDFRGPFLSTLIHEFLHKWYPYKSETWVLKEESRIVNKLSPKQVRNIIKAFAAAL